MNCRKVNHLLSAYIDGELPGVEQLSIRTHISACDSCRAEYDGILFTKRLLGRMKVQTAQADVQAKILCHIASLRDIEARRTFGYWSEHWRDRLSLLAPTQRGAVAAFSLAVLGVFAVMQQNSTSDRIVWSPVDTLSLQPAPSLPTEARMSTISSSDASQVADYRFVPLNPTPFKRDAPQSSFKLSNSPIHFR